jgi:hypothetical protein
VFKLSQIRMIGACNCWCAADSRATRGPTSGSPAVAWRSRPREASVRTARWPATAPAPARLVPERSGRHHRHIS